MMENAEVGALRERLVEICQRRLPRHATDQVVSLARPAIRLHHTGEATHSHLGGAALLDHPDQWPHWNDRPLSLVAVLDLAELAPFVSDPAISRHGALSFFYDYEEQPWGFKPEDRGGWRVVADPATAHVVAPPERAEAFVSIGLAPVQALSVPGWEEPAVEPVFPPHQDRSASAQAVRQAYFSMQDDWNGIVDLDSVPNHQVGGWPRLQQNPIWRDCDVVSRGLPLGTLEEWRQAEAQFRPEQEADWRLLLQLDTDDDAGWMWGDVGTLFFTIRQSTPLPAAFDEAWLVLQCG